MKELEDLVNVASQLKVLAQPKVADEVAKYVDHAISGEKKVKKIYKRLVHDSNETLSTAYQYYGLTVLINGLEEKYAGKKDLDEGLRAELLAIVKNMDAIKELAGNGQLQDDKELLVSINKQVEDLKLKYLKDPNIVHVIKDLARAFEEIEIADSKIVEMREKSQGNKMSLEMSQFMKLAEKMAVDDLPRATQLMAAAHECCLAVMQGADKKEALIPFYAIVQDITKIQGAHAPEARAKISEVEIMFQLENNSKAMHLLKEESAAKCHLASESIAHLEILIDKTSTELHDLLRPSEEASQALDKLLNGKTIEEVRAKKGIYPNENKLLEIIDRNARGIKECQEHLKQLPAMLAEAKEILEEAKQDLSETAKLSVVTESIKAEFMARALRDANQAKEENKLLHVGGKVMASLTHHTTSAAASIAIGGLALAGIVATGGVAAVPMLVVGMSMAAVVGITSSCKNAKEAETLYGLTDIARSLVAMEILANEEKELRSEGLMKALSMNGVDDALKELLKPVALEVVVGAEDCKQGISKYLTDIGVYSTAASVAKKGASIASAALTGNVPALTVACAGCVLSLAGGIAGDLTYQESCEKLNEINAALGGKDKLDHYKEQVIRTRVMQEMEAQFEGKYKSATPEQINKIYSKVCIDVEQEMLEVQTQRDKLTVTHLFGDAINPFADNPAKTALGKVQNMWDSAAATKPYIEFDKSYQLMTALASNNRERQMSPNADALDLAYAPQLNYDLHPNQHASRMSYPVTINEKQDLENLAPLAKPLGLAPPLLSSQQGAMLDMIQEHIELHKDEKPQVKQSKQNLGAATDL